jgi:hypothetical protein
MKTELHMSFRDPKPLWTCPDCGRQFITPNKYHSCGRYDLEDHFTGKDLIVRQLYILLHPSTFILYFRPFLTFAPCLSRILPDVIRKN